MVIYGTVALQKVNREVSPILLKVVNLPGKL